MKELKFFFKSAISVLLLGIMLCCFGCKNNAKVICSFEFINPETGETLGNDFGELYLTYDGEQKNIEFKTIRDDNGKEIKFIEEIKISYTYKNPSTGKLEYGKPYMQEAGEYYLCINNCLYDEEKYYISYSNVSLTIYLQEEGAPKDIEINILYPINQVNGEILKYTFSAPYSMCYSITTDNVEFKVYDARSNVVLQDEGDCRFYIDKGQNVIIEIYANKLETNCNLLVRYSPEVLSVDETYNCSLGYAGQRIYKFKDSNNHSLKININNTAIGFTVYDSKGQMVYVMNDDNYSYIANQEVYIHIYNTSNHSVQGNLIITDESNIVPD